MVKNQNHRFRGWVTGRRRVSESCVAEASGWVPGNKKSAGSEAIASSVAVQAVSIGANGRDRVVAISAAGFGRAAGGTPIKTGAAHITKPSTGRGVTSGPASPGLFRGRAG